MKFVNVREAKAKLIELLEQAQDECVVLTRRGQPVALLIGMKNYDLEDLGYMTDPAFWTMIRARRKEATIPWEEVQRRAGLTPHGTPPRRPPHRRRKVR